MGYRNPLDRLDLLDLGWGPAGLGEWEMVFHPRRFLPRLPSGIVTDSVPGSRPVYSSLETHNPP